MELGLVGIGKMGANMASRLARAGHVVVVTDRDPGAVASLTGSEPSVHGTASIEEMIQKLHPPRTVWVMVPAGEPTDQVIAQLVHDLSAGDTIVDGGNSNYKDTKRRSESASKQGIVLIDAGTSGGIWGLEQGYCLMLGGPETTIDRLSPIFCSLAPGTDLGWGRVGSSGAGHFAKMVHNGIEYGLMQAYAEGFEVLAATESFEQPLDLAALASIWRHGSVVRSWLLDLVASALKDDPALSAVKGWVADSGEGRWAVAEAIDLDVPAPVITASLLARLVSRQPESFAAKLLAALRQQFGGHSVVPPESPSGSRNG